MPGSSPYQAVERFVDTLTLALSCLQPVKLFVSADGRRTVGEAHAVATSEPLRLRCAAGDLVLSVRLNYVITDRPDERRDQRYKVSTQRYQHSISDATSSAEIIAWHWHPGGSPTSALPHIHVTGPPDGPVVRRGHVPSGRVTVEAVVRYALSDLACTADREDWEAVLDKCEGDFRTFATWGSRRPQ